MKNCRMKKLTFYNAGFNEVLAQTGGLVRQVAEGYASLAGNGFEVRMEETSWNRKGQSTRPVAFIHAATDEAKEKNAVEKTLQNLVPPA